MMTSERVLVQRDDLTLAVELLEQAIVHWPANPHCEGVGICIRGGGNRWLMRRSRKNPTY